MLWPAGLQPYSGKFDITVQEKEIRSKSTYLHGAGGNPRGGANKKRNNTSRSTGHAAWKPCRPPTWAGTADVQPEGGQAHPAL